MSRRPELRRTTSLVVTMAACVVIAGGTMTACAPAGSPPAASPSRSIAPTATASSAPTAPAGPVLVPDGTAAENLPLFATITDGVWAGPEPLAGRSYIDALVAAGFDKAAMQVTADQSTVGNPAESIQFAVRWKDECLVGQVGPATGTPVAVVVPAITGGACLVGATRPIDW